MRNFYRMLFSGVAALAVLGGTCSAATIAYHFEFTFPLGSPINFVSGVVSFTAPVPPFSTSPPITDVTFQFDQSQPLLSTGVVNGLVNGYGFGGSGGTLPYYVASFGPGLYPGSPAEPVPFPGDFMVSLLLDLNNDPLTSPDSAPLFQGPGGPVTGTATRVVPVTPVVPEPATLWLLGMTLAGVAVRRRRR